MRRMFLGLGLMLGCADVGPSSGALSTESVDELTDGIRYYAPEISATPLTATEIGDTRDGIPVGLRVHEGFLVAWAAPLGEPRIGDHDAIVAAWRIESTRTPIAGDVAPGDEPTTEEPRVRGPYLEGAVLTPRAAVPRPGFAEQLLDQGPTIDIFWWDDATTGWIDFWFFHPGCA